MTMDRLAELRVTWEAKPVPQAVYENCYRRIVAKCVSGLTLELGGGTGNLKSFRTDIITSDMQWAPWMDMAADAQGLPLKDASLDNIVMFDVLHHVEQALEFIDDELVEVTPRAIRLRKKLLKEHERKCGSRAASA